MEESGAEPKTGGYAAPVPDRPTDLLEFRFMFDVHFDVSQKSEIVPGTQAVQVGQKIAVERRAFARSIAQDLCVPFIREELNTAFLEDGGLDGKLSAIFKGIGQRAGGDLAGFHVRLIERVDFED